MVTGIIGQKIGMTQLFNEGGVVIPATVIKAGPCVVVQQKNVARDGYEAVQLGLVESRPARVNKAIAGHYKNANAPPTRVRRAVKVTPGDEPLKLGEHVLVSLFASGDRVDVIGVSRGKDSRAWSSGMAFVGVQPVTGRCSTADRVRSARRPIRRAS